MNMHLGFDFTPIFYLPLPVSHPPQDHPQVPRADIKKDILRVGWRHWLEVSGYPLASLGARGVKVSIF